MKKLRKKQVRSRILQLRKLVNTDFVCFRRKWVLRLAERVKEIQRRSGVMIMKDGKFEPAAYRVIEETFAELRACGKRAYREMSSLTFDTLKSAC